MFQGILFVLFTGTGWKDLLQELRFGSGMTRWRRGWDWTEAGVLDRMHQAMLDNYNTAGLINFGQVIADASHTRGKGGRRDRAELGRPRQDQLKHRILTFDNGVPLVLGPDRAVNLNDHLMLPHLLDQVHPLRGQPTCNTVLPSAGQREPPHAGCDTLTE